MTYRFDGDHSGVFPSAVVAKNTGKLVEITFFPVRQISCCGRVVGWLFRGGERSHCRWHLRHSREMQYKEFLLDER